MDKEFQEGKFFAVIAYICFLCIVTLVLKKDNRFAVRHGKVGLVLFVFEVGCFLLSIIPLFIWVSKVLLVALGLISLWGILQALTGKPTRVLFISDIADKIIL